jgi:competence protein ComEC
MALTGFPASVMRAGIMLIFTSLMFLLSHRVDSISSMFIAVVVIIIAEPYAIFDIGLWLSMFATLGILLFIEFRDATNKQTGKATLKTRLIRILVLPVFISAFAFGGTFLLSALTFEKFSLLAMLTTPIYGIAIEIYMYLGLAVLICGRFLSIGSIAGPIGNAIIKSVRGISSINGIYLSAEYAIIRILIVVFTVALIAFAVLDIKRKRGAVALLMGMLFLIFAIALFCSVDSAKADRFEYSVSDGGEFIVMQNDGGISLLDLTTPSTRAVAVLFTFKGCSSAMQMYPKIKTVRMM